MNETKVRILDAAERLIATHGLDVSLRTITAEAGVNLAAVNYHFQSKEALLEALVARRFDHVNSRRIEMLDALEAEFPNDPPPLERLLEAFVGPLIEVKQQAPLHQRQLMGRLYTMPDELLQRIFSEHMLPTAQRFGRAFRRAVPGLSEQESVWKTVFTIGAVAHLMSWSRIMPIMSGGLVDPSNSQEVLRNVVAYAAAGFRASAPQSQGGNQ